MYVKLLSMSSGAGHKVVVPTNPVPDVAESRHAMGTVFEILIYGDDTRNLAAAAKQALQEIAELDKQLSRWKESSDVSWINRHAVEEPVRVAPELFEFLLRCRHIWRETNGAFDITVSPLVEAWGFYRKKGRIPPKSEMKAARGKTGMQHVRFDEGARTVLFDRQGVQIDLGGIGKGYAVDRAAEFLEDRKVKTALINSGTSTMYAIGSPPGQDAWHIGIRDPEDEEKAVASVALRDGSVSTSGAPEKAFEIEGKKYSHILDPRTGFPAEGMISTTAVAACATDTDALATSFYVLGREGTTAYCKTHKNVKAILVPHSDACGTMKVVVINFDRP